MKRYTTLLILGFGALSTGCGLAETAATATAGGASEAAAAASAKQTEARIVQQLDDAQKQAAAQREAADGASQ